MPVYEYYCGDCHITFETLRSMSSANEPVECSSCGDTRRVNRTITTFAAIGSGDKLDGAPMASSGGGCCGGTCGCR